jgi:hypothetical protein
MALTRKSTKCHDEVRERASDELILVFAVRHLSVEREVLVLKVRNEDFYAFSPYSLQAGGRRFDPGHVHHLRRRHGPNLTSLTAGVSTRLPHTCCGTSDLTVLHTKAYCAFLETRAMSSSNLESKSFRMGDSFDFL